MKRLLTRVILSTKTYTPTTLKRTPEASMSLRGINNRLLKNRNNFFQSTNDFSTSSCLSTSPLTPRDLTRLATTKSPPEIISPEVEEVLVDYKDSMLKIQWNHVSETETAHYPWVWLRDNCQCSECFHTSSHSRRMLMKDLDIHVKPINLKKTKKSVEVFWSDGHASKYPSQWLYQRAFLPAQQKNRLTSYRLNRIHWGSKLMENLPRVEFTDIMESDSSLLSWLELLEQYGLVIIGSAGTTSGQVTRFAERIAFVKKTHYGEQFDVIAKPNPSNVAYSSGPLQLHTDLPYYEYKPGTQFIHCLKQYQGLGGESQVTDAAHVARELERLHPEKYKLLTEVLVDWCDVGSDLGGTFYKILRQPVICLDSDKGYIKRINFSQPQRDSYFNIPVSEVVPWYDAMKTFHDMLYHPDYCITFKMIPGTILTFDNLRIVHGRTGYESEYGERHVQGCYVDWDEVRSRRRVLQTTVVHSRNDNDN